MAAQNILLGSGLPIIPDVEGYKPPVNQRAPAWRYHRDLPEGKVCKTDEELDQADADGWLDHPGKVRLLIGHEKVWEAQKKLEADKIDEVQEKILTAEPIKSEDTIRADILKIESDKVEAKRLEDEKKVEEKRLVEYKEAKSPPGPRLCTLCGKEFSSLRALNMHGIGAHKNKK